VLCLAVACGSDGDRGESRGALITQGVCSRPVPALTDEPVTRERLEAAIEKMRELETAAAAGGAQAANAAFAGDTHAVTHDIDPPLRAADPALAEELCAAVVVIEQQLGGNPDLQVLAREAGKAARSLEESGTVLGVLD
jgi:hypothetical protein